MESALIHFANIGGGGGIFVLSLVAKLVCIFQSAIWDSGVSTPGLNVAGEAAVRCLIQFNIAQCTFYSLARTFLAVKFIFVQVA